MYVYAYFPNLLKFQNSQYFFYRSSVLCMRTSIQLFFPRKSDLYDTFISQLHGFCCIMLPCYLFTQQYINGQVVLIQTKLHLVFSPDLFPYICAVLDDVTYNTCMFLLKLSCNFILFYFLGFNTQTNMHYVYLLVFFIKYLSLPRKDPGTLTLTKYMGAQLQVVFKEN